MPSKIVSDLKKSAEAVNAAAQTHADRIGQALKTQWQAHLQPGETMPDAALMVRLFGRSLDAERAQMEAADQAHEAELRDDEAPRQLRDQRSVELYEQLVGLRDSATALYGVNVARELGLVGETPTDPVVLARLGNQVMGMIGKVVKLPPARLAGASLDLAAVQAQLGVKVTALEGHLKDVARETREAQVTLTEKHRAIDGYARVYSGTADALSGLLTLAGEPELAERVRPSRRRSGQTTEGEDGKSDGGAGPSGGVTPPGAP